MYHLTIRPISYLARSWFMLKVLTGYQSRITGKLDHKSNPAQQGLIQFFFVVCGENYKSWILLNPL